MRIMWRGWGLGALLAAGAVVPGGLQAAGDAPVVHLKAVVNDGAVRLEAAANAPFEYTTYRPTATLYVVDFEGVAAGDEAGARVVASDLVKSYRVVSYASGKKPMVRVELLVAKSAEPKVERKDSQDLALVVTGSASAKTTGAAPAATVAAAKPAAVLPTAAKTASVSPVAETVSNVGAIRQVNLTESAGTTQVNINGTGNLAYRSIRLKNPDRLVLDFTSAHLRTSETHITSNLDPVREIRLAQFTPEVSRVVIDLRSSASYSITNNDSAVTVSFSPEAARARSSAAGTASTSVTTTKSAAPKQAAAPIHTATAKPAAIPAPPAKLPASLTASSSALATPAAAPSQSQPSIVPATATVVANTSAPAAAEQTISAPVVATPVLIASSAEPAPQPSRAAAQAPAATGGKYSGEPISVNLKDVDLRDFFRLIHEISGLNVVVDPAVKGNLTIVLDDVPWDQALDIVLKNNDLDKQLDGNVLRVATKDTIRKEAEENRDLAKAQAEAADVVTTTRQLSYAKATTMATTLKKFLSSRGDVLADDRSNTLIIRDIPTTLPVIDNLIRQLDRKSQQVEIEARVVAANRSFSREIGTELAFAGRGGNNAAAGGQGTGGPVNFTPPPPVVVGTSSGTGGAPPPVATALGVGSPTSGIQYLFSSTNFALDYIITAAEDRGVGKLLSKPKVITQNNEKATVKQGTKIPVQTIVNNTVSVQFVDAVLELDVTPQITAEGTIYMDVTVENDAIDASIPRVEGIPAIDTQSAETKVTVNDGATVVIGGIIVTNQRTDIQQVPLVGSIPLLGNLFKHTTVSSTSQELLFFLTPRILPS